MVEPFRPAQPACHCTGRVDLVISIGGLWKPERAIFQAMGRPRVRPLLRVLVRRAASALPALSELMVVICGVFAVHFK